MGNTNLNIQAVERGIGKLVRDWRKLAFNFHSESDIKSRLYSYLVSDENLRVRLKGQDIIELVHTEFPVRRKTTEGKGRYDVVVWEHQAVRTWDKRERNRLWGAQHDERARSIPLLVAIEIKHLGGGTQWIKTLSFPRAIRQQYDIRKLLKGPATYCYFLAFSDEDLKDKTEFKSDLVSVEKSLKKVTNGTGSRLRVLCVSRDGWEITPGFTANLMTGCLAKSQASG